MKPSPPLLLLMLALAVSAPCHAQDDAPVSSLTVPRRADIFTSFRYDAAESGALFCVAPAPNTDYQEAEISRLTATQFAEAIKRRVLREPHVSALVPQTMLTIAPVPKNGDPFAGMDAGERFQVLLGTLSPAQWNLAGSDAGIGIGDLTPEQQPLFAGMFPAQDFEVQTYRMSPERGADDEATWQAQGKPQTYPVRGSRLRLRRQTTLSFPNAAGEEGYFSSLESDEDEHFTPGATKTELANAYTLTGDPPAERVEGEQTSYGVPMTALEANRVKPSDLNLSAPVFQTLVLLDGSHKTVGELLTVCAQKTRLNLLADKRMAQLPIAWRVAEGGHNVSVSEVLKLLCRSVTGTFRLLTPPDGSQPLYLLTDDREGLGTRLARLADWQQQMQMTKQSLMSKANRNAAKADPLSYVRFAPDDPLALPPALNTATDAAYRGSEDGIAAKASDLPPALRDATLESAKRIGKYRKDISTERIRVGANLVCDYVFPGGKSIEAPFGRNISSTYLHDVATTTPKPKPEPTKAANAPVPALPRTAPRRVCVLPLPDTDAETKSLLTLLRAKGFTEAWFPVSLHDADAPARLEKAATIGKSLKIAVGASASWLKRGTGDTGQTDDINLLGEPGARFIARMLDMFREQIESGDPTIPSPDEVTYVFDYFTQYMSGWTVPNAKPARAPLLRLLAVPGLSAVALTDTAAPGWNSDDKTGGSLLPGFALGYTLPTRIACVRATGIDPVDVSEGNGELGSVSLLQNDSVNAAKAVNGFRFAENRRELSALTAGLAPNAALYLEQPAPFFDAGNMKYTRFVPGDAKPTETLGVYSPVMDYKTDKVTGGIVRTARTTTKSGFVVDFGRVPTAAALRYLKAIADAPVQ